MGAGGHRPGEFDLISRYLAPLSAAERGAFHLTDDAALIAPRAGCAFVVTADAIVEGVHFLRSDPAFTVAQKALRVNLSDLAAKGAKPRAYLMTVAWPTWVGEDWVAAFAQGLLHDQTAFGITLVGGDTVSTPGPLSISITAFGEVAKGRMIQRRGARPGDDVWVTGIIGDAGLGLKAALGTLRGATSRQSASFLDRYRVPCARVELVPVISRLAHASVDISDGLVADLNHVARVSRVGIRLNAGEVPLSPDARALVQAGTARIEDLMTSGDDFEVAFTSSREARARILAAGRKARIAISRIGEVSGRVPGVTVFGEKGEMLQFARTGFTHF